MLLPLLLLPWAWGALAGSPPVPPASVTLRLLQTDVFHSASSTDMWGTALLGDLETYSMDCRTCPIRFLQPWARQGLTPKEWQDLETLIHYYLFDFNRTVNRIAQRQGKSYPFVTQASLGCELHPNGTSGGFYDTALNGEDFLSFDVDTGTWLARRGDRLGAYVQGILNQNKAATIKFQFLLRITCVSQIKSFVQHGNESLERQERPVAVVFAGAPPPAGTPAPFLLVCRVTGFYPRPVRVAWLQDGEEVGPGWRLDSSGILPNADLTYQLRSSLAVEPGAGHSYACRVEHSSLGGQSLLIPWGSPPVPPVFFTLRLLQTDVFHSASSTDMWGTALLDDLETHSMDCRTCPIRFLQPWARQGLTPKQWQDLETLIHYYLFDFNRTVNRIAQRQGKSYPFVTQASLGCELHPNGTSGGFYDTALNGEDFLSFDVDTGTWLARRGDRLGAYVQGILNQNKAATFKFQFLLRLTCVSQIKSFVQHGNESLERQERPVAVVFAGAPLTAGTPAPFLLVCRVTGFYPRPVRVAWLQDGEEVGPGWQLDSSGILPNADLTYQLRSSLAVEPGAGHSYACRVEHSSLGGRSLLIPWEQSRPWGPGLAVGVTLGAVAVVTVAVVLWRSRRSGYQDVRPGESRA